MLLLMVLVRVVALQVPVIDEPASLADFFSEAEEAVAKVKAEVEAKGLVDKLEADTETDPIILADRKYLAGRKNFWLATQFRRYNAVLLAAKQEEAKATTLGEKQAELSSLIAEKESVEMERAARAAQAAEGERVRRLAIVDAIAKAAGTTEGGNSSTATDDTENDEPVVPAGGSEGGDGGGGGGVGVAAETMERVSSQDLNAASDLTEPWENLTVRARIRSVSISSVIWKPCMTDIYMYFICAHYRLYGTAPVVLSSYCCSPSAASITCFCLSGVLYLMYSRYRVVS